MFHPNWLSENKKVIRLRARGAKVARYFLGVRVWVSAFIINRLNGDKRADRSVSTA
jgi:hypothetical protein